MLEVTESATAQFREFFNGKTPTPIRIFVNSCGCSGPGLAMALDEPTAQDETFTIEEFTFLVEKGLMAQAKPIKVDFLINGFKLDSSMDFGPAMGCSSCGSGGSCH